MGAGPPKKNKNAEKHTIEEAKKLFEKGVELTKERDDLDFIGEVAYELGTNRSHFDYLVDKFPELKPLRKRIKENCEVNCFRNGKKGNINTAMAIVNLKSNHNWTDRQEVKQETTSIELTPEERAEKIKKLKDKM